MLRTRTKAPLPHDKHRCSYHYTMLVLNGFAKNNRRKFAPQKSLLELEKSLDVSAPPSPQEPIKATNRTIRKTWCATPISLAASCAG